MTKEKAKTKRIICILCKAEMKEDGYGEYIHAYTGKYVCSDGKGVATA